MRYFIFILFLTSFNSNATYVCWYNTNRVSNLNFNLSQVTQGGVLESFAQVSNNARQPLISASIKVCGYNGWNVWHNFAMTNGIIPLQESNGERYGYMKISAHSNRDVEVLYLSERNMSSQTALFTGSYYPERGSCSGLGTDPLRISAGIYFERIPLEPVQLPSGNVYAVGVNAESDAEARAAGTNCNGNATTYQFASVGQPLWTCKTDVNDIRVDFGEISSRGPARNIDKKINIDCGGVAYNMISLEVKPSGISRATDQGLSSSINNAYIIISGDMHYDNNSKSWKTSLLPQSPGSNTASAVISFSTYFERDNLTGIMNAQAVLLLNIK